MLSTFIWYCNLKICILIALIRLVYYLQGLVAVCHPVPHHSIYLSIMGSFKSR